MCRVSDSKYLALALLFVLMAAATTASASVEQLDRGHRILIEKGLQIQAHTPVYETVPVDHSRFAASNFTSINFANSGGHPDDLALMGDVQWGRWWKPTLEFYLTPDEMVYLSSMVSFQFLDEQNLGDQGNIDEAKKALEMWRLYYPDVIGYCNGTTQSIAYWQNYMSQAEPDMLSFDMYPFYSDGFYADPGGASGARDLYSPTSFYQELQTLRTAALGGHDGSGDAPIPYAVYTQAFKPGGDGHIASESEIRLNHFAAWAFGYTFTNAYLYQYTGSGSVSILFDGVGSVGPASEPTNSYSHFAAVNAEGRNLGPALVGLLSTDVRFIPGEHNDGGTVANAVPNNIAVWDSSADPYITSISATNPGSVNDGLKGDIIVGYFEPLMEVFDGDAEGETYFMVVNGLSGLTADANDAMQNVTLAFDFGDSGIDSLQKLSRETGSVDTVALIADGGSAYHLDMELPSGTGELFKFDTGAPFTMVDANSIPESPLPEKEWTLTDVGRTGEPPTYGLCLNNDDVVGGQYQVYHGTDSYMASFSWESGVLTGWHVFGDKSAVNSINDSGVMVGWSDGAEAPYTAYVRESGVNENLPEVAGATWSYASDINNSMEIAGKSGDFGALWTKDGENWTVTALSVDSRDYAAATGINAGGDTVGDSVHAGAYRAVYWESGNTTGELLPQIDYLSGEWSFAEDITTSGSMIAGYGQTGNGRPPVVWVDNGSGWDVILLGSLGRVDGEALAVNPNGVVVGRCKVSQDSDDYHAFVWDELNGMRDLNELVAMPEGWVLEGATDINDWGSITGYGSMNGETHAFLLSSPREYLKADLNQDRYVNLADFAMFASEWLMSTPDPLSP